MTLSAYRHVAQLAESIAPGAVALIVPPALSGVVADDATLRGFPTVLAFRQADLHTAAEGEGCGLKEPRENDVVLMPDVHVAQVCDPMRMARRTVPLRLVASWTVDDPAAAVAASPWSDALITNRMLTIAPDCSR